MPETTPTCFRPSVESLEARDVPAAGPVDALYLLHTEQDDLQQIAIGSEALALSTNPAVRRFGLTLVQTHLNSLLNVLPIMALEQVPPQWLDPAQQAKVAQLGNLRGPAFDSQFAAFMVQAQSQDLNLANYEANAGTEPLVRAKAAQSVQTLFFHLQIAQQQNQSING